VSGRKGKRNMGTKKPFAEGGVGGRTEGTRCGQCGRDIDGTGCCGYGLVQSLEAAKTDLEKIQSLVESAIHDVEKDLRGTALGELYTLLKQVTVFTVHTPTCPRRKKREGRLLDDVQHDKECECGLDRVKGRIIPILAARKVGGR
jgi:hypothetical protein